MKKNLLITSSIALLLLSSCQTPDAPGNGKRKPKTTHVVYHKQYTPSKTILQEIGDPNDLDSTAVYKKHVGKTFHDMFEKNRGRSQSSHYNPSRF